MFDSLVQEILDKLVNLDKKLNELENDYISKELDEAALNDLFEKVRHFITSNFSLFVFLLVDPVFTLFTSHWIF